MKKPPKLKMFESYVYDIKPDLERMNRMNIEIANTQKKLYSNNEKNVELIVKLMDVLYKEYNRDRSPEDEEELVFDNIEISTPPLSQSQNGASKREITFYKIKTQDLKGKFSLHLSDSWYIRHYAGVNCHVYYTEKDIITGMNSRAEQSDDSLWYMRGKNDDFEPVAYLLDGMIKAFPAAWKQVGVNEKTKRFDL